MGWRGPARGLAVVLLAAAPGSCVRTQHLDYEARPVAGEQEDRVVVERAGVRAMAGPPAEFPYVMQPSGRSFERGRYQLFTRIRIENRRRDVVEVLWPEARIEVPGGEAVGLVESAPVSDGANGDGPGAAPVDRVEPGGVVARAVIPESLRTIEVDEPLIALCDGCEYRIVVPVRVGGKRESLVLPFRLAASRPEGEGVRFLFWDD